MTKKAKPRWKYVWEGRVSSVGRKYFWARVWMKDKTEEEIVRVPLLHLSKRDRDSIREGSFLGMRLVRKGSRHKIEVKLTHLKPWTKAEIEKARRKAEKMTAFFGVV